MARGPVQGRLNGGASALNPVIGVTAYSERARWDIWDTQAALAPQSYLGAVTAAGGNPVVLPPTGPDVTILERLDGLVLTAGPDIDPGHYDEPPHPESDLRPGRDDAELALAAAARRDDLPLLGICRGMQILAIAGGGSLHQHLPDVLGDRRHCRQPGVLDRHRVSLAGGSRVAAALGRHPEVNSHHHQAVRDPGDLTATGWSEDGVIEALEDPDRTFVVGVQWHPELEDVRLFAALAEAAKARRPGLSVR